MPTFGSFAVMVGWGTWVDWWEGKPAISEIDNLTKPWARSNKLSMRIMFEKENIR